ncbi:MAG: hypothetical protein FWE90_13010, partial [Defluviitaleaceae bacterium]|nr:hypothetical protein [Defluviitaleaceae bacterium]
KRLSFITVIGKGGESMSSLALSLIEITIKAFVKVIVTTLAKHVVYRRKGGTAPIRSRDGSDKK